MLFNLCVQISPVITPHARSFVHHILVYLCSEQLTAEEVGLSEPCSDIVGNANQCRGGGTLVGAWAVGGEVAIIYQTSHCIISFPFFRTLSILKEWHILLVEQDKSILC